MKISDDLIKEITVKKGVEFSAQDMSESMRLSINEFKPNTRFYVLLIGEEGSNVSNEAKRLAAAEVYKKYTHALALCSKNPLQAIAGNLFLRINKPKIPTRFFETREEALFWLRNLAVTSQK
jgi:hypothetical protein